jgi:hypothetical protein
VTVRCSSLPLVTACPAASVAPQTRIDSDRAPADLGTAAHWVLTEWIAGRPAEITDAAQRFQVEMDDLKKLARWGWEQWQKLSPYFPDALTEQKLEYEGDGVHLIGHVDVLSEINGELRLGDFKTGRLLGEDHDAQLKGYAFTGLAKRPHLHMARCAVIRVREFTADWEVYTREELDWWFKRLAADLQDTTVFRPGRQCSRCPRAAECPAKTALLRQYAAAILEADDLPAVNNPGYGLAIGQLYDRVKLIEDECESALKMIRAGVAAVGGKVNIGNGRELVLNPQERREVLFGPAYSILQEELPAERLDGCCKVAKGKIEEVVRSEAGGGRAGGRAVKELMDRLQGVGAIAVHGFEKLEVRRDGASKPATTVAGATAGQ